MNFDHNAAPLQQLVDCSDAFSSNEVILIEKFYLHPIYFSIHPIQNIHKRKINLFFIFFAYFSSSLRTPNFSPDLNFRKMSKYPVITKHSPEFIFNFYNFFKNFLKLV